jgi:NAD(P)-dependent dehydrogenase (short-subunit alcohol dehydrogenase family)
MNGLDFTGRSVLVTGASHGIGAAVAADFARTGASVTILSSTPDIHDAAELIKQTTGHRVRALVCDITDRAAVRQSVGDLGRLDVLINNAGLERITPIAADGDEVERTFVRVIEIIGTYYVTREAVRSMTAGSSIIITASIWSKSAAAEFSAYVISKHGNLGFMRVLAKELGPRGIRVNAVCPGWVKTRAALNSLAAMSDRQGVSQDEMLDEIIRAQALPGLMEPADVTSLYLFLASDLARNITGQAVNVDRGEVMA